MACCILFVNNASKLRVKPKTVMSQNNTFFDDSGIVCIASNHNIMSNSCNQRVVPISAMSVFPIKTVINNDI